MNEKKTRMLGKFINYVFPVCLMLSVLGLVWVGKNSIVIGATITTVDKELKEAYLERDAFNAKMIKEASKVDSVSKEFRQLLKKKTESDVLNDQKIDRLNNELEHEQKQRQEFQKAYAALRDSIDHIIKLQRSAVEGRYKDN